MARRSSAQRLQGDPMRVLILIVFLSTIFLSACGRGGNPPVTGTREIAMDFSNLEHLGNDFTYTAWLVDGPTYHRLGNFDIAAGGATVPATLSTPESTFAASEALVISIEAAGSSPVLPSAQRVLAGEIQGDGADLSIADQRALGDPFTGVGAQYILETATTAAATDYMQGIYWCVPGEFLGIPEPVVPEDPNLDITMPQLPPGWVYEGWVVLPDQAPVSTGRFTDPLVPDSDELGPAKGPDPGMPFPGQEFIDPPKVLTGGEAWLTVEPEPDYSPAPGMLKVLVDTNIEDKGATQMQWTENNALETRPTGSATFTHKAGH
jgi:hypothetical protein